MFLFFSPLVLVLSCTYAHLSSSSYSLLPPELPPHCSETRGVSALLWTWETAWHEKDQYPACDSGQRQMPEKEFSSRIIIESHLSGVTSQLPVTYVSEFLSEKCYLCMQYASKDLPSVNKSTHPFNSCKHYHPHGCSHHVLKSTWSVSDDAERDDRLFL